MDSTEASDGKRKALTTMCDSGKRLTSLEGRGSCYKEGGRDPNDRYREILQERLLGEEEIKIVTIVICLKSLTTKSISTMSDTSWLGSVM